MNMNQKINQIRRLLKKHKANQIILKSEDPTFFWIFQKETTGAILIINKSEIILIKKLLEDLHKDFLKNKIKIITIKKNV